MEFKGRTDQAYVGWVRSKSTITPDYLMFDNYPTEFFIPGYEVEIHLNGLLLHDDDYEVGECCGAKFLKSVHGMKTGDMIVVQYRTYVGVRHGE